MVSRVNNNKKDKAVRQKIFKLLEKRIIYLDGAMGTLLQGHGVKGCPELINLNNPKLIESIHKGYADAGADIIITNTFGANRLKLANYGLEKDVIKINKAGVRIARNAAKGKIIAGDISELGKYIEPLDSLTFDEALDIYREQIKGLEDADILFIETISDIKLLKAAVIAAKETGKLIISSMTFDGERTTTGTDVKTYTKIADALGVDIIGANCSVGPKAMVDVAKIICNNTNKPVMIKPNAGVPKLVKGKTVFQSSAKEFAKYTKTYTKLGVNLIGGCCGTDFDYIKELVITTKNIKPVKRNIKEKMFFSSRTKTVELDKDILIIGERINPSGRKDFREEIKKKDFSRARVEALKQMQEGANLLDINVGVPGSDEVYNLPIVLAIVQNTVDLPLVIDSSNPKAIEEALKMSDGRSMINSFYLSEKSIKEILPLAKKYGAGVIGLAMDKKGVPKTAKERIKNVDLVIKTAKRYGLSKNDVLVDLITTTIATDDKKEIIEALKAVHKKGYNTVLGVSNISHGMDNRSDINQKFFTECNKNGLSVAILNPIDNVLRKNTKIIIKNTVSAVDYAKLNDKDCLYYSIINGDKDNILSFIEKLIDKKTKASEINDVMIKALESVGEKFNNKEIFLPQVLSSAGAMKLGFERIREVIKAELKEKKSKESKISNYRKIGFGAFDKRILIATVENDIHDIGKNIVITVLESHGYEVIDLGKSVPFDKIIKRAVELKVDIIALSALMTTTAPEIEKLVKALKDKKIKIPVIAGGAVITEDYAKDIDAYYSRDALSALKVIKKVLDDNKKK